MYFCYLPIFFLAHVAISSPALTLIYFETPAYESSKHCLRHKKKSNDKISLITLQMVLEERT